MSLIGSIIGSVATKAVGGMLGGNKKESGNSFVNTASAGSGLGDLKGGIMSLPDRKDKSAPAKVAEVAPWMEYASYIREIKGQQ